MDHIERLKELDGKATKGPWARRLHKHLGEGVFLDFLKEPSDDGISGVGLSSANNFDGELSAAYRNATPKLIALLEKAEGALQYVMEDDGLAPRASSTCRANVKPTLAAIASFRKDGV